MKRCLKIVITGSFYDNIAEDFVKKHAQKAGVEGTVSLSASQLLIMVCGQEDNLEEFIDALHRGTTKAIFETIDVEPFLKDRDYRGVFRVIE